ncbi:MAG: DUF1501 domain-containing protein, partial [Alphaproteobacteria bacterium]|nr:DUF1501 domain-containing protein [Alphaproteobacteria bacterium]
RMGAAGRALARTDGPRLAALALDGWDAHSRDSRLGARLRSLDAGLGALERALGPAFGETAVLVLGDFGRGLALNAFGGTDHGAGTVAFLAGGATAGGAIRADWPGLAGRPSLPVTTDVRALIKGVLHAHLGLPEGVIEDDLLPGSRSVRMLEGLRRVSVA